MDISMPAPRDNAPQAAPATAAALSRWLPVSGVAVVAGMMIVSFSASMLLFTRGHLSAPLDDTFIYFQYARQIAHGDVFRYQAGDPRTSGATGFAYPFVLAAGYMAGFRDDRLVIFAFLLNAGFLLIAIALVLTLLREITDYAVACGGAVLVAMNGWLGWTFFAMMETGLHTATLLLALFIYLKARDRARYVRWLAVCLALMPYARPEMAALAVVIGATWMADAYLLAGRRFAWVSTLPLGAALASSLSFVALMVGLTGHLRPNTYFIQSVTGVPGTLSIVAADRITANFFEHVRFAFSWFGPPYVAALVCGLFLFGCLALIAEDRQSQRLTIRTLLPIVTVAGVLSASLVSEPGLQLHRWAAPYEPLVVLISVYGLWTGTRYLPSLLPLFWPAFGVLFFTTALATVDAVVLYGQNSSDIYFQEIVAARWLRDNTPANSIIAVNDAGASAYFSRRRISDLVGLVAPQENIHSYQAGAASVFEHVERMPEDNRPTYFAIYPQWFMFSRPELGFLAPVAGFKIARLTAVGGDEQVVYLPDYSLMNTGDAPGELPQTTSGWSVRDSVDVADLASEKAHDYRMRQREVGVHIPEVMETHSYRGSGSTSGVIDGGRAITGRERFVVKRPDVSKPYVLALRVTTPATDTITVTVNGQHAVVALQLSDGFWHDVVVFTGTAGGPERLDVEVEARPGSSGYSSFHYWLVQPD